MNIDKTEINIYFNKKSTNLDKLSFNLLWNGYSNENNNKSIITYLEENDILLKNSYVKYVYEIKNNIIKNNSFFNKLILDHNFHIWWISKIEEKSYYKQPKIFECLKILALKKIIDENNIKKINLFYANSDIVNSIKDICSNKEIYLKSFKQKNKYNYFNIIYKFLRSIYHFFKFILPRIFFIFKPNQHLNNDNKLILFDFFNYYNYENIKNKNVYESEYWGGLTKYLSQNKINFAWIHIFYKNKNISNIKKAFYLLNKIKDKNEEHLLLDSYINSNVIINTFLIYFKSLIFTFLVLDKKKFFYSKSNELNLWNILKSDFLDSFLGPDLIINSFYFYLFKNIMPKINKNINCFFICENQSIEKSLIYNWKKISKKKIIAIQNSTVRFWDLRYAENQDKSFIQKKTFNLLYDKLLINGDNSNKILTTNKYYHKYLDKVEAFRYENYLNKKNILNYSILNKNLIKILVIGDASDYINANLLNYFLNLLSNKINFLISFKPHPLSKIYNKKKYKKFLIENENITKSINKYDLFVTSNTTSASLDLFLLNVNLFVMLDNNIPNFSPVRNFNGVKFFNESDNFIDMLNETKFNHSNHKLNSLYNTSNYNLFTKYIYD